VYVWFLVSVVIRFVFLVQAKSLACKNVPEITYFVSNIGMGNGGQGGQSPPPNLGEKIFFGKRHVIFGQMIYFWKKEEQAPFIFDSILFFISCVREVYSFEF